MEYCTLINMKFVWYLAAKLLGIKILAAVINTERMLMMTDSGLAAYMKSRYSSKI